MLEELYFVKDHIILPIIGLINFIGYGWVVSVVVFGLVLVICIGPLVICKTVDGCCADMCCGQEEHKQPKDDTEEEDEEEVEPPPPPRVIMMPTTNPWLQQRCRKQVPESMKVVQPQVVVKHEKSTCCSCPMILFWLFTTTLFIVGLAYIITMYVTVSVTPDHLSRTTTIQFSIQGGAHDVVTLMRYAAFGEDPLPDNMNTVLKTVGPLLFKNVE